MVGLPARQSIRFICIALLAMFSLRVYAGSYLLVNSGNGTIYQRFSDALQKEIARPAKNNTLTTITLKQFNKNINTYLAAGYTTIISTGIEAGIAISQNDNHNTIIMAMMPRLSYQNLTRKGELSCVPANCQVIYLDQPIKRQIRLLKLAFPDRTTVGVIGSPRSIRLINKIQATANTFSLSTKKIIVNNENELISTLNQGLGGIDVLMAIPDPIVYNQNTARAILLATFNQHIPLFAYSRSFVRAGAIIGVYSTPEQIAHHVSDILTTQSANHPDTNLHYPKYFSVDINQRAAEALNISLPNANSLKKRLEKDEKN